MPVKRLSLSVWVSYKVNGNKRATATKTALNKNPHQKTGVKTWNGVNIKLHALKQRGKGSYYF